MMGSPMLIAATITASLLVGGLLTLLRSMTVATRERLQLAESRLVWLGVWFTAALMLFMFLGGLLVDSWGTFDVLAMSTLLGGFSIVLLGLSKDEKMAWGAAAALGAATGLLHTAVAVVMPAAFFTADLTTMELAPASMNFGYIFVILGGLLMPFLSLLLVRKLGFRNGLLILALIALVPAGCIVFAGKSSFPHTGSGADVSALLQNGHFWLALVAVFFIYSVETSAVQWATRYLTEVGYGQSGRTLMFFGFWAIFILSRLVFASIKIDILFPWLLLIAIVLTVVILGNMSNMFTRGSGGVCFLLFALCLAPIFPTLIGLLFEAFPAQPAVAFGLVCAVGTIGRLIAEPAMKQPMLAEHLRLSMTITMLMALVIAVPALIFLILQ